MAPNETAHDAINKRIDEVDTKAGDALTASTLALSTSEQVRDIVQGNTQSINDMRKENSAQHTNVSGRVDSVYNLLVTQQNTHNSLKLARKHWLMTTFIGLLIFGVTTFIFT